MNTQRWFKLTIPCITALILGVLVGYWFGHPYVPVRHYTVGHYGSPGYCNLYRYDTHTGKTWRVRPSSSKKMRWEEIAEPYGNRH